jgi:putative ABC transport system permease protein
VYANLNTIRAMIAGAKNNGMHTFDAVDPDKLVSSVLINVSDGYSVEEVMNDINIHVRKVEATRTQSMISNVSDGLTNIAGIITVLIAAIWVLALVILLLAFSMIGNERKKEFAILRGMGASQRELSRLMAREALLVSLLGSLIGALLAAVAVLLFANFIRSSLSLPFLTPGALGLGGRFLLCVAVSVGAGVLASTGCVRKVSRVDPALVLRGDNG